MKTPLFTTVAIVLLLSVAATTAGAQAYKNAVGLRLGYPWAVSYKHNISEAGAVEVYGGARFNTFFRWYTISAAYQQHYPLNLDGGLSSLRWYWGAGASAYFWSFKDNLFGGILGEDDFSSTTLGVNGYLGLELPLDEIPLVITVDWVPTLFVGNGYTSGVQAGYGGIGVRYILGR